MQFDLFESAPITADFLREKGFGDKVVYYFRKTPHPDFHLTENKGMFSVYWNTGKSRPVTSIHEIKSYFKEITGKEL